MAQASDGRGSEDRRHLRSSYHHGDLPNALADAATEMARAGGPDAIVLRAAARAAGVSAAAAYRHFADHDELLQVVRQRALDALGAAMRQSLDSGATLDRPRARVAAPAACARPGLHQVRARPIPGCSAPRSAARTSRCRTPPSRWPAHGPYALLSGVLDELVEHGVLDPARRPGAEIPAWAAVHGLATLLTDGPLALLGAEDRAAAIERNADFLLNGIGDSRDVPPPGRAARSVGAALAGSRYRGTE